MNAKKIMGAVLVAFLAAALFIGAGAAASGAGETVFVYEEVTAGTVGAAGGYSGTWTKGADSVTFVPTGAGVAIVGDNIVEGVYTQGNYKINVMYPNGVIVGQGTYNTANYPVIGASYYEVGAASLTLAPQSLGVPSAAGIVVIGGDNVPVAHSGTFFTESIFQDGSGNIVTGTYKLQVYFDPSYDFITTAPQNFNGVILGKDVYTITIVDGADPTITAAVDSVIVSNTVDVTITGLPGVTYTITAPGFTIPAQAAGANIATSGVIMPNTGKVVVTLEAGVNTGDYTVTVAPTSGVAGDKAEVTFEIVPGTITAAAEKDAYYIGNKVVITGTSTAGASVNFYIAGTNLAFQPLTKTVGGSNVAYVKNGKFEFGIDGNVFNNLDAGTYTVYVAAEPTYVVAGDITNLETYTTVALVLKQPFISVTDAPSVAVKGSTYKVSGTAEAAANVYAYIFGTNFFAAAQNGKPATGDLTGTDLIVELKKNNFTVKAEIPQGVADMAAGQYFMVIQHPMYDKMFNIAPNGTKIILNSTGDATITTPNDENTLFDVTERQKANAAEALCQALDTENIDDMYVKLSFVVAAPQSIINQIPETVAQGEKLTVSGSTNVGAGEVVTVEMLSTAFAAVPKATVGSASFISLTTKTDENGNWEVTFDTSGLNVDEYTLTAAVNALGSSATAKINVVEAAPEQPDTPDTPDVPDTPDTPDTPTEPETPGFGALAALAGLGAVAVLLLRRE